MKQSPNGPRRDATETVFAFLAERQSCQDLLRKILEVYSFKKLLFCLEMVQTLLFSEGEEDGSIVDSIDTVVWGRSTHNS